VLVDFRDEIQRYYGSVRDMFWFWYNCKFHVCDSASLNCVGSALFIYPHASVLNLGLGLGITFIYRK
jgi:hypothetical protein